jgi:hypothetical protein
VLFVGKKIILYEYMAGNKCSKQLLNKTLVKIVQIILENNIKNWFIAYGTLLGIVREDSCIDNDDDVDIIIENINYDIIKDSLKQHGFEFEYNYGIGNTKNILKIKQNNDYASVDFYMSSIDKFGNFTDEWMKVIYTNCYDESNQLVKYSWNDLVLNLPFNYESKLQKRYGSDWKTPKDSWGTGCKKL